ncbi:hypothetical protein [Fimbriiglobus ruber]|uniref:Uncharacterized protein n=1 Tax=Fimbriiglobus ruber TaxID=1908690 RepID=A0A225DUW2_9BACT|nr:hypothetical protein [Fimbriiglobus ruber]OWK39937.1 hypothetical protein FRUB_05827 [Fimbriiglobus ruber]
MTPAGLAAVVGGEVGNLDRVHGRVVAFMGTIISVGKGVDGGVVPQMRIDGWDKGELLSGWVFVHNVDPDRVGRVGDRIRVRGMIVGHGSGTFSLWSDGWNRENDPAPARTPNTPPVSMEPGPRNTASPMKS